MATVSMRRAMVMFSYAVKPCRSLPQQLHGSALAIDVGRRGVLYGVLNSNGIRLVTTVTGAQGCVEGRPVNVQDEIESQVNKLKQGVSVKMRNPQQVAHTHFRAPPKMDKFYDPIMVGVEGSQLIGDYEAAPARASPSVWTPDEVDSVRITHKEPEGFSEKAAFFIVKALKSFVDTVLMGFNRKIRTEKMWIDRICFLESIAAIPGMMAAMTRHLNAVRTMRSDQGWINTLLEEAENERMHLMVGLTLKQPSTVYRNLLSVTQVMFSCVWLTAYIISPQFCHHFCGYLEEEAILTYTKCLWNIEHGQIQHWKTMPAPAIAKDYWHLPEGADTMKDVILHIRADENHHRIVNHTIAQLKRSHTRLA